MPYVSNTAIATPNSANAMPYTAQQQQEYLLAQQLAMQQFYMQYMQQYMNAYQQTSQAMLQQNVNNTPSMPFFTQPATEIPIQRPQQPADPVQAANPPPDNNQQIANQPRFGNIAAEDGERLDWLDLFYVFSRLMVLVTLVYFYSSPFRCLIVIFFAALYYL